MANEFTSDGGTMSPRPKYDYQSSPSYSDPGSTVAPMPSGGGGGGRDWMRGLTPEQRRSYRARQGRGGTAEQDDALQTLSAMLGMFGLESGNLTDWLWGEITTGTPEQKIFFDLRQRPEYKARFPGMDALRKAGLPALSESEYLSIETQYKSALRQAGAKPQDYDSPEDFIGYFSGNISPAELQERSQLWQTITQAPNTTARAKEMFAQYAGINNFSNEALFKMLVGSDMSMAEEYSKNTGHPLNALAIQQSWKAALMEEQATFRSGGGSAKESNQGRTGVTSQEEEGKF